MPRKKKPDNYIMFNDQKFKIPTYFLEDGMEDALDSMWDNKAFCTKFDKKVREALFEFIDENEEMMDNFAQYAVDSAAYDILEMKFENKQYDKKFTDAVAKKIQEKVTPEQVARHIIKNVLKIK